MLTTKKIKFEENPIAIKEINTNIEKLSSDLLYMYRPTSFNFMSSKKGIEAF